MKKSGRRGSNPRPSAWKANALSTELLPQYVYIKNLQTNGDSIPKSSHYQGWFAFSFSTHCGQRWIRTTEVERQQIYSLPHLATLEFALILVTISENAFATTLPFRDTLSTLEPLVGFEPTTPRLQITCSGQLS